MFFACAGRVGRGMLHAEMIEDFSLVDGGGGLGDQFGAAHGLAVPVAGAIESDFDAVGAAGVGRVFVGGGNVEVGGRVFRAVDVVLVGSHLVAP